MFIDIKDMSQEERIEEYKKAGIIDPDVEDADEGKGEDPTPDVEPEKEPEKDEEEKEETTTVTDEDTDDEEPDAPHRPEKYIPVPKYVAEKKKWQETEKERDDLKARLTALESQKGSQITPTEINDDLEAYIAEEKDKNPDFDEEGVRRLAKVLSSQSKLPDDISQRLNKIFEKEQKQAEKDYFDKEFEAITPLITKKYPNATPAQLKSIKENLDVLAHTKELRNTPLNYIFLGNADELLPSDEDKSDPVPRRSVEASRSSGVRNAAPKTAKDYKIKDGMEAEQIDAMFNELGTLDQDETNKIIAEMDTRTWNTLVQWQGNQQGGLTVDRGGTKVKLK